VTRSGEPPTPADGRQTAGRADQATRRSQFSSRHSRRDRGRPAWHAEGDENRVPPVSARRAESVADCEPPAGSTVAISPLENGAHNGQGRTHPSVDLR